MARPDGTRRCTLCDPLYTRRTGAGCAGRGRSGRGAAAGAARCAPPQRGGRAVGLAPPAARWLAPVAAAASLFAAPGRPGRRSIAARGASGQPPAAAPPPGNRRGAGACSCCDAARPLAHAGCAPDPGQRCERRHGAGDGGLHHRRARAGRIRVGRAAAARTCAAARCAHAAAGGRARYPGGARSGVQSAERPALCRRCAGRPRLSAGRGRHGGARGTLARLPHGRCGAGQHRPVTARPHHLLGEPGRPCRK